MAEYKVKSGDTVKDHGCGNDTTVKDSSGRLLYQGTPKDVERFLKDHNKVDK